jgi:hypothetical protein
MSVRYVHLPESLHKMAKVVAGADNISLNHFIVTAVAEKIAALTPENHLNSRAMRGFWVIFDQAFDKVPAEQPQEFDRSDLRLKRTAGATLSAAREQ